MANNKELKDGNGNIFITKTTETAGINVPHVNVDFLPIDQPLTDTQLRATPVPISGTVTANTGLSQPLTDTQLRANAINALIDGSKFTFSTLNSSSTPLTIGSSFIGTVEPILNYPSISLLFKSDQSCIILVTQYEDESGLIEVNRSQFIVYANQQFLRSYPINGNYIRVSVKNVGVATTTVFELNTAYGVIDSSTQLNNNSIGLTEVAGGLTRDIFRTTFSNVIANGVDPTFFDIIRNIGTGQTVSQSAGNLVLTSGTTINQETVLRSTRSFSGSMIVRIPNILSQRIVNNNFFLELVDIIGDGLACTINSATSITVTIPNSPFTSLNVGHGMYLGAYNGTGTFVPQRATIASVSGNNITYTVASMAVGSGTCSVWGWNYYQLLYNSTSATNVNYDAQRRGWNSGFTNATINSTAGVGHMPILQNDDGNAYFIDQLTASTATIQQTIRASRVTNSPEEATNLFLQIRMVNGTTAPASNTTWTINLASIEKFSPVPISINNIKPQGIGNTMPVTVQNTVPISGTVTTTTALQASTTRIGFQASSGIWYDDSSTTLASNATFTGTARDLTLMATATQFANGSTYGNEFRVGAESDVTGTLWIETSRDNTNWRRVKSIATVAVTGGGFFAEIIHLPSWRYVRVGYTNGAGAQARFTINSIAMA